jgi:hypothetical protein
MQTKPTIDPGAAPVPQMIPEPLLSAMTPLPQTNTQRQGHARRGRRPTEPGEHRARKMLSAVRGDDCIVDTSERDAAAVAAQTQERLVMRERHLHAYVVPAGHPWPAVSAVVFYVRVKRLLKTTRASQLRRPTRLLGTTSASAVQSPAEAGSPGRAGVRARRSARLVLVPCGRPERCRVDARFEPHAAARL